MLHVQSSAERLLYAWNSHSHPALDHLPSPPHPCAPRKTALRLEPPPALDPLLPPVRAPLLWQTVHCHMDAKDPIQKGTRNRMYTVLASLGASVSVRPSSGRKPPPPSRHCHCFQHLAAPICGWSDSQLCEQVRKKWAAELDRAECIGTCAQRATAPRQASRERHAHRLPPSSSCSATLR